MTDLDHTDWRSIVSSSCARAKDLCEQEDEPDLARRLAESDRRLQLGLFRLVVMGEIKKGKSSFINALLGEKEIVPTASDVATSTVFKILYAPESRMKVFFRPDVDTGKRKQCITISPEEVREYGTEAGNPGNRKNVDFIGIEVPNPLLKTGLVIVDTPGVGGLFRQHRDITWQYAPMADAICFVLDSAAAVISAQEIEFLQDLVKKITRRIFFVQTKIDTVDEAQWRSWEVRNKTVLVEKLGIPEDKLLYFPISSQLKHDADETHDGFDLKASGFLPVLDFLRTGLLRSKEVELAKDVAREIVAAAGQVASSVGHRKEIYSAESKEKLGELQAKLTSAKEDLRDWRQATLRGLLQNFTDRLVELKRQGETRLMEDLDPDGAYIIDVFDSLRNSPELKAAQLKEGAGMIIQQCVDDLSKAVMDVQGEFNHEFQNLLGETLNTLASGLDEQVPSIFEGSLTGPARELEFAIDPDAPLNVELTGVFGNIQRGVIAGGVGATIATIGITIVGALFPPALAVAPIAALLGGIIGGSLAGAEQESREFSQVLDRLRAELSRVVRQVQRKALTQFRENSDRLERKSRDTIDTTVDRIQKQLENRLAELGDAGKLTAEETREKVKAADEQIKKIARLTKPLEPLLGKGSPKYSPTRIRP